MNAGTVDGPADAASGVTQRRFAWRDDFTLGQPSMDDMHREFVDRVDRLLAADDTRLGAALDDFEQHAQRHFGEEDDDMRVSSYDAAGCHIDEHAAVLASLSQVKDMLVRGRFDVVRAFAVELARWFPEHVQVMDQGLARWLMQRRLGGSPITIQRRSTEAAGTGRALSPHQGQS
jgi:hemerythrin